MCTLDDICAAAGWLCRWDGRFALVHRPDRLPEVFDSMQKAGIEPKRASITAEGTNHSEFMDYSLAFLVNIDYTFLN